MPLGLKFFFKCSVTGYNGLWFEFEQLEDVLLERAGFGQLVEAHGGFAITGAAGVFASCSELGQQCAQTVYGPAINGLLCTFFLSSTLGDLGLGDGVAFPSGRIELVVLEQHGR